MGLAPGMQLHGIYSKHEPRAQIRILSLGHGLTEITGVAEIRCSVDLGHYGIPQISSKKCMHFPI